MLFNIIRGWVVHLIAQVTGCSVTDFGQVCDTQNTLL